MHTFGITITFPVMCTAFNKVIKNNRDGVTERQLFSSIVKGSRI